MAGTLKTLFKSISPIDARLLYIHVCYTRLLYIHVCYTIAEKLFQKDIIVSAHFSFLVRIFVFVRLK